MNYLVVSCSYNENSRSRILAQTAFQLLKNSNVNVALLELNKQQLPICDGDTCYTLPNV
ncbi:MAG: NAD(P)H-dependent oxidoreductase, partial [Acidobacteriota bacterium]